MEKVLIAPVPGVFRVTRCAWVIALCSGVVFILLSGGANAAIIKNLEFNEAGILPSNEPDIEFFNNTGSSETSLYSVSGGFLQQRTFGVTGNASYHFPRPGALDGGLDASLSITLEARLRVLDIDGQGGAYFQAFDRENRYSLLFEPTGVALITSTGIQSFAMDVTEFRTYRLFSPGGNNSLSLFVDDLFIVSVAVPTDTRNNFGFADGITTAGNGANVDWDYLRVSQVPVPAGIWLFGSALLGFFGCAKHRKVNTVKSH